MGTRSVTYFLETRTRHDIEMWRVLCCYYRQCDGYPEGNGLHLAMSFNDPIFKEAYGKTYDYPCFNGIDDMAAGIIMKIKSDAPTYNVYMRKAPTDICSDRNKLMEHLCIEDTDSCAGEFAYFIYDDPDTKEYCLACYKIKYVEMPEPVWYMKVADKQFDVPFAEAESYIKEHYKD